MKLKHISLSGLLLTSLSACEATPEAATEEAPASSGQMVRSQSDLPECDLSNEGKMYWIESEKIFMICEGENFTEIASKVGANGNQGSTGNKGTQGDQGETGPDGDKGETGEDGDDGADGDQGDKGANGSNGSDADASLWLFDGNNNPIAMVVDTSISLYLMENGGLIRLSFKTGDYVAPIGSDGRWTITSTSLSCSYVEADCSGTCYQMALGGDYKPIKGGIYKSLSGYFTTTGLETPSVQPIQGYQDHTGTCYDLGAVYNESVFAIATPYALPSGISLPLTRPLSVGPKE